MPKTVYVTPAQRDAAKLLVEHGKLTARPLSDAVRRIAEAEVQKSAGGSALRPAALRQSAAYRQRTEAAGVPDAPVQKVASKQTARQAIGVATTALSAVIGLSFLSLIVLLISALSATDVATPVIVGVSPVIVGVLTALLVGAILSSGLWAVGAFSNNHTQSIIGKLGFLFTTAGIALLVLANLLSRYLL